MTSVPVNDVPHAARAGMGDLLARLPNIFGMRFQVLEPVAIGGMATIVQLKHRLHGGLFAAKVLHPELAVKPGVVRGFRQEAVHAAMLGGHPNAVPVFDFGEMDGLFYMLMPFIEGEDLDCILSRSQPFTRDEALQLAAQVSSVLSHAERHGIAHCDLTPGNIRLDRFGLYRLLDFGISTGKATERLPFTGGTPLYTSPERIRSGDAGLRGDLYALGAILVEAMTGTPAFHGETLEAIQQRHLRGDWQPPAVLSSDDPFLLLLRRLLAITPAERPESAFELSGILDALGYARPEFRGQSVGAITAPLAAAAPTRRRLS